jgi:uncharacterized membrane protein
MTWRRIFFNVFLWLAVIGLSLWVGGTVFSISVIVPMWNESPPESVREFFGSTSFNKYIFNFFGPPWMVARNLPVLIALILGWYSKPHRKYLLITFITFLASVLYTLLYIYPINEVLMQQAGGNHSAEKIKKMADQWIFADRLRFAVGCVGYFFLLKAFRLPIPDKIDN